MQQRHGIDLKISIEHLRVNFQKIAKSTPHGIMDKNLRRTQVPANCLNRRSNFSFVSHVTRIPLGVREFSLQGGEPLARTGEHRHLISTNAEATRDSGACSGANAGTNTHYCTSS